ncbi:MAG: flavin reductase family protein [Alicyclobacillus macrosporangiidus]|uniref:flavin reductase family protein n=1 Tax=Alicyclobacillus macrosporangiidus TaxID=392015 RepID=UPI0026F0B4D9|nr:flavin reductase family protein [Alicyclobacillus macrosporangiidus]MCL6599094.1 flavin reductase family protein [Alicyclobacillus macrosporangiidus]
MELSPDALAWQDSYKLLVGCVVPRPIAFVSTQSRDGVRNLAAFSFFNGVCPKPFIISFAPMFRGDGAKKDTLRNIEETGQFVVNVVSDELVQQMNLTSPEYPPEVDEFAVAGLTPVPSRVVAPPRVAESPIQMECERVQILQFGDGPGGGFLVLGRVVHLHVRDDLWAGDRIDGSRWLPVGRMAGNEYTRASDRFRLKRPSLPEAYRHLGDGQSSR